jgi:hypothetical protein
LKPNELEDMKSKIQMCLEYQMRILRKCLDWYGISSVKAALRAAIQVAIPTNLLMYRANVENAKARRDGILDCHHF